MPERSNAAADRSTRPRAVQVLLVPLLGLFRPRAAARCLAGASRPAFVTLLMLGLLVDAAVVVALMLWDDTQTYQYGWRPPAKVWHDWHVNAIDGWLGPPEIAFLLVIGLGPCLPAFLAWLNLPLVHGAGSVWRSYGCSFRVASGWLWPLAGAVLVCGGLTVQWAHQSTRIWYANGLLLVWNDPGFVLLVTSAACGPWLAVWLERAARALTPGDPEQPPPPHCEGCGYDLTHQPAERRCPECGLGLDDSLVPGRSRPGSAWARRKSTATWLRTRADVLFRPRAFYRRLQLRTPPGADAGFALWNYVLIGCCAAVWAVTMLLCLAWIFPPPLNAEGWIALFGAALAVVVCGTLGCWFGHRFVAAIAVTAWLARRGLPDFRWAAKVIVYESVFLWVFCAYWGTLLAVMAVGNIWLMEKLGRFRMVGPFPVTFAALLVGTAALGVAWLCRYRIAYRAIRWSNF